MVNALINFSRKATAVWDVLGEKVETTGDIGTNIVEALKKSKANYDVSLQPVVGLTPELVEAMSNDSMINAGDLLKHVIGGVKATMRTDNNDILGCVSDGYGVLSNTRMFEMIGMLCSGKDMNRDDVPIVESAGVIGGGKRAFVVMRMPMPIRITEKGDDIVEMFALGCNSFDSSGCFQILLCPFRIFCSNQLNFAIKHAANKLSFKHTRFINERVDLLNKENAEMAYRTLGMYDLYKKYFEAELEHLKNIKLAEKDCERILAEALFPEETFNIYKLNDYSINSEDISTRSKNMLFSAMDALESGVGQNNREIAGTGLHLVNAISTLFQNHTQFKDNEKKFISVIEGNAHNKMQKVHDLVLQYEVA